MRITTEPPLRDLARDLKAIDRELAKELQREHKQLAEHVAEGARQRYGQFFTTRSGRGRGSIRPRGAQTGASVAIGGARAPYVAGQNFGALATSRDRLGRLKQSRFGGRVDPDRFLFRTVQDEQERIVEMHGAAVDRVMRKAGFE